MAEQILSKSLLNRRHQEMAVEYPDPSILDLPEKVVQFGTGVLLRGLPDYFIDQANKQGVFLGRIVVIKSTDRGDTSAYDRQDKLYTQAIRGIVGGKTYEKDIVNGCISRVLSAQTEWAEILSCAREPLIYIVISNTTEQGLVYHAETIDRDKCPESFPGKLLAYLYERYTHFKGAEDCGMVIIPTELVEYNGDKLKRFVQDLAMYNKFADGFLLWLDQHNIFCNSLVDRIVPGKPQKELYQALTEKLQYQDDLMIMSEPYGLWAIEGNEALKEKLGFALEDSGVKVVPDITLYKELKLRLLNATHILACGKALVEGFPTVKAAMQQPDFDHWIKSLMQEISVCIPIDIDRATIDAFSQTVSDRFANPFIEHFWKDITFNYTDKLKARVIPLMLKHVKNFNSLPSNCCEGWAYYFYILYHTRRSQNILTVTLPETSFELKDPSATDLVEVFHIGPADQSIRRWLSDVQVWGTDLSLLPGFCEKVSSGFLTL